MVVDPLSRAETLRAFDIVESAAILRALGKTVTSLEDLAAATTHCLFSNLTTELSRDKACVLVRFFHTVRYEHLEPRLRKLVIKNSGELRNSDRCLVLLGTSGVNESWNQRHKSSGHKVIPLLSPAMVGQSPMIARLLTQLGIEISSLFRAERPEASAFITPAEKDYNIFYVREARDSPFIPAKEEFVEPYGVRSVIGYGSALPSGEIFAVIMFFRIDVSPEMAQKFSTLSLSTMIAWLQVGQEKIFNTNK